MLHTRVEDMGIFKCFLIFGFIQMVVGDPFISIEFESYKNHNTESTLECCGQLEEVIRPNCTCYHDIKICLESLCEPVMKLQSVSYQDGYTFQRGPGNPFLYNINQRDSFHLHIVISHQFNGKRNINQFSFEFNGKDSVMNSSSAKSLHDTGVSISTYTKRTLAKLEVNVGTYDIPYSNCDYNQCYNGGKCSNVAGVNHCACGAKYTGTVCQTERSCDQILCQNGGVCKENVSQGYSCICKKGFSGLFCEINAAVPKRLDMNDGVNSPFLKCHSDYDCKNNGSCNRLTGKCNCDGNYAGDLCHYEVLECENNACNKMNSKCLDVLGSYICECSFGYGGPHCDKQETPPSIQPCPSCQNGGTCLQDILGPVCLCPDYFTGKTCETFVNTTTAIHIHGVCQPKDSCSAGHYICDKQKAFCKSGWKGENCTTRWVTPTADPECPNILCKNDGFCFKGTCCCRPNFTGRYCEENLIECPYNPCKNGGKCQVSRDGYICGCTRGYKGENCTIPVSQVDSTSTTKAATTTATATTTTTTTVSTTMSSTTKLKTTTHTPTTQSTTRSTTPSTTTHKPVPSLKLFLKGRIKPRETATLKRTLGQQLLQTSLNAMCTIDDLGRRQMIDTVNGSYVTEITISSRGCKSLEQPGFRSKYLTAVKRFYQNLSFTLYEEDVNKLDYIENVHKLYLNGYVDDSIIPQIREKLTKAWRTDQTGVVGINITVIRTDFVIGNYGTRVTKLLYLASSNNGLITPTSEIIPKIKTVTYVITNEKPYLNTVYDGQDTNIYVDSSRLSLLKTKRSMIPSRKVVSSAITDAWVNYIKANYSGCKQNCSVKVKFAKEEPVSKYNSIDARTLVYFPLLDGSLVTDLYYGEPRIIGLPFCQCSAARRERYIDVNGRIKLKDMPNIQGAIRKAFNVQITRQYITFLQTQHFLDREGQLITRIPFLLSANQDDNYNEWPNPNMAGNIVQLTSEIQKYPRTVSVVSGKRIIELILGGSVKQSMENKVINRIKSTWSNINKHIPNDKIRATVEAWSDQYFSEAGGQVTRVQYSITIGNADSSLVDIERPELSDISKQLSNSGVTVCNCVARHIRTFGVIGVVNESNKTKIESALDNVWRKINQGLNVNITANIQYMNTEYETQQGQSATKIQYYVSVYEDRNSVDEDDLDSPTNPTLKADIENGIPGIDIHTEPLKKKTSESFKWWIVALAVIGGSIVFILLTAILIGIYKRYGNSESRTLLQKPEDVDEFDKEHFSEEPDFDNPSYNLGDQAVDDQKKSIYTINGN